MSTLLSTHEVALLLNVTETTIKRWADEGRLPCSKTLGGHRKFEMENIIKFAEKNGIPLSGVLPPPMTASQVDQLQLGIITRNYKKIADVLYEEILQSDREGVTDLFLYLFKHHIPFYIIADEIVRPALAKIGDLWEKGEISVHEEHIASQTVTEALIRIAPDIHRKPSNGLSAVFACFEGELHDIGLRTLAYAFESEGWRIHYLGPNTPTESIISFVKILKPELVALSFTIIQSEEKIIEELKEIVREIHAHKGKLIIGGYQIQENSKIGQYCDRVVNSTSDALAFAADVFDLKRGPKLKKKLN